MTYSCLDRFTKNQCPFEGVWFILSEMNISAHTLGQLPLVILLLSALSNGTACAHSGEKVVPFPIVVLGDSLTEGYGIAKEQAFPALLEKKFHDAGADQVKIINAGISGSTSSSAVGRLNWILKSHPAVIILALGANDGLRGIDVKILKKNLEEALKKIKEAKVEAILVGMKIPPNYGKEYSANFEKTFVELSREHQVKLIPFLLEGTAGNTDLTQPDGLHPNEKGHVIIANSLFNQLGELRERLTKANPPKPKLLTPDERRPR